MENEKLDELTRERLIELESRPKTKVQKILDVIKLILPIIMGVICVFEYVLYPNLKPDATQTNTYVVFIWALVALYGVFFIASFFKKSIRAKLVYKAPFYAFVFFLLTLYDFLTLKTGILTLPYFPWVDKILNSIIADKALLIKSVKSSLKLLFSGYFIGAILGLITGILCGYSKKVNYWISPFMKLLGPIPTTTWLPLVMVLATSLFYGSVFIIALGVWYAVTISTITGILNVDKSNYEAAKTLGATGNQLITKIAIPSAMPNIFGGLTIGMSSACTALLIAEMLGVESGLGWYITWKKSWAEYASMYGAIIIICLTFIAVNFVLSLIKKRVLKWQEGME
ncbi:ABC transporter permease [Finegoldia magna]|uniref:ABC transporter permease n=1 Tax=Finegoldia magna TaxID=1260 RepID=UPI00324DDACB